MAKLKKLTTERLEMKMSTTRIIKENLDRWLKEYDIEDEARDILIEQGYEAAVEFVYSYFGDYDEAEFIVSEWML